VLIERYNGEKEHLVTLRVDAIYWTVPEIVVIDNCKQHMQITDINVQHDLLTPNTQFQPK